MYRLLVIFFIVSFTCHSREDIAGAEDHPLLSRYPGTEITAYQQLEYDEALLLLNELQELNGEQNALTQAYEGKVTNINYKLYNSKVSLLQLYRNYEKALQKLNAEVLFSCRGEKQCAYEGVFYTLWLNEQPNLFKGLHLNMGQEPAFFSAEIEDSRGNSKYLMLAMGVDNINKYATVALSIIEPEVLDTDKLKVLDSTTIANSLKQKGKLVLEGLYFDHNKAEIQPQSRATLGTLAEFLHTSPNVELVYIVGHTDNSGQQSYNQSLSQMRAENIVKTLIEQYDISASRLQAFGVGPLAPVAENMTEGGRQLNRRVELVLARQKLQQEKIAENSKPNNKGEKPWFGEYEFDVSELPAEVRAMIPSMPSFVFNADAVNIMDAGQLLQRGSYQSEGKQFVLDFAGEKQQINFSDDYSYFSIQGGDGSHYRKVQ